MNLPAQTKTRKGFTLIELLVVIGVLAVLLTIVLIAINPARQFSQSNDTKRRSDVNALLNAVHQYAADHRGVLPGGAEITTGVVVVNSTTAPILCTDLVSDYLAALPVDPQTNNGLPVASCSGAAWNTNYTISRSAANSRITVSAPGGELDANISVTR